MDAAQEYALWRAAVESAYAAMKDSFISMYEEDPAHLRPLAEEALGRIARAGRHLQDTRAALEKLPVGDPYRVRKAKEWAVQKVRYDYLVQRLRETGVVLEPGTELGAVVVVALVVAGVGLSMAALAWIYTAHRDIVQVERTTEAQRAELIARVASMATGKELPPSTLPMPPPDSPKDGVGGGLLLVGLLVVGAGAALWATQKSAS